MLVQSTQEKQSRKSAVSRPTLDRKIRKRKKTMSNQIRKEVLKVFKNLHRTREHVFNGDERALLAARTQINSNFRKNREITDQEEIKKLIKLANDVDTELRTTVVQAVERKPGIYEVKIRKEIPRLENVPFNPDAVVEKPRPDAARCGKAPKLDNAQ